MNFKTLALATVAAVAVSGAANAATLTVENGIFQAWNTGNYDNTCAGGATKCYNPAGGLAPVGLDLQTFFGTGDGLDVYPGLKISGPATLRITFLGKEAAATNAVFNMGGNVLSNMSAVGSIVDITTGSPTVDFTFRALSVVAGFAGSAGFGNGGAIAFHQIDARSVYAFFDDSGAELNRDWDDMVVKIEVIPVPAAGFLLLGGLGALAAMKRRRKAA